MEHSDIFDKKMFCKFEKQSKTMRVKRRQFEVDMDKLYANADKLTSKQTTGHMSKQTNSVQFNYDDCTLQPNKKPLMTIKPLATITKTAAATIKATTKNNKPKQKKVAVNTNNKH